MKFICVYMLSYLCLTASVAAQEKVKVDEILDCNLFRLHDGRRIRLANVETPSVADTGRFEKRVAKMIMEYLQKEVKGVSLRAEFIDTVDTGHGLRVHLYRKYDLNTSNINQQFLEKGYGYYLTDPQTMQSEIYFEAAQKAYRQNTGIWYEKKILRSRVKKLDQRWRASGGLVYGMSDRFDDENSRIPMISIGYRISKLIPLIEKKEGYLSISAGFESILLLIQNVYLGPEIRIRPNFSFSYHIGSLSLYYPFSEEGGHLSDYQCVSLVFFIPGEHLEFETGIYFLENDHQFFRFSLCISN